MVHFLSDVDHGIHASEGVHGVTDAHHPCNSIWPATCSVECSDEAGVVIPVAHGEDRDGDDDEAEDGYRETCLRPLSEMLLWDCEDGDDCGCQHDDFGTGFGEGSRVIRIRPMYSKYECQF